MKKLLTSLLVIILLASFTAIASADSNISQTTIFEELKLGDKGTEVSKLQTRLAELGFYTIAVDGDYGKGTVTAIEKFQRFNDLEATGVADNDLQFFLYSENAKGMINSNNKFGFCVESKVALWPFLDSTSYPMSEPYNTGDDVFFVIDDLIDLSYHVEDQHIYEVSIYADENNLLLDSCIDCIIDMAKSLNPDSTIDADNIMEAVGLAIENPYPTSIITQSKDMVIIYDDEVECITIKCGYIAGNAEEFDQIPEIYTRRTSVLEAWEKHKQENTQFVDSITLDLNVIAERMKKDFSKKGVSVSDIVEYEGMTMCSLEYQGTKILMAVDANSSNMALIPNVIGKESSSLIDLEAFVVQAIDQTLDEYSAYSCITQALDSEYYEKNGVSYMFDDSYNLGIFIN